MKKQIKKDQRGFSLVEVLIAMTILAIVSIPLLRGFAISAKTNLKSRNLMRATSVAQNIMEGLAANSLEEVALECNYGKRAASAVNFDLVNLQVGGAKEVIKTTNGSGEIIYTNAVVREDVDPAITNPEGLVDASILSKVVDDVKVYEFKRHADDSYHYCLQNIESESKKYDALIAVTKSNKENASGSINAIKTSDIKQMNEQKDAFYIDNNEVNDEILAQLRSTFSGVDTSNDNLTRTFRFKIEQKTNASGKKYVAVSMLVQFTAGGHTYPSEATPEAWQLIKTNQDTPEEELDTLYLFYNPIYHTAGATDTDTIYVENKDKINMNLYIVKQKKNDSMLETKENNYRAQVKIDEGGNTNDNSHVSIRTNLDLNLSTGNKTSAPQGTYYVNGSNANVQSYVGVAEASRTATRMKILDLTEASNSSSVKFYDVTVKIFPEGTIADNNNFETTSPIVTLNGGIDN